MTRPKGADVCSAASKIANVAATEVFDRARVAPDQSALYWLLKAEIAAASDRAYAAASAKIDDGATAIDGAYSTVMAEVGTRVAGRIILEGKFTKVVDDPTPED